MSFEILSFRSNRKDSSRAIWWTAPVLPSRWKESPTHPMAADRSPTDPPAPCCCIPGSNEENQWPEWPGTDWPTWPRPLFVSDPTDPKRKRSVHVAFHAKLLRPLRALCRSCRALLPTATKRRHARPPDLSAIRSLCRQTWQWTRVERQISDASMSH